MKKTYIKSPDSKETLIFDVLNTQLQIASNKTPETTPEGEMTEALLTNMFE